MFNFIIQRSIQWRFAILLLTALAAITGAYSYRYLIIDAVPDITNVQVQINTAAPGMSPFEVEQRITFPLEVSLAGLSHLDYTRSLSRYGLSQITVVFHDKTDIHFARTLVAQRVAEAKDKLPEGVVPTLGPLATGLGEIYMYTVEADPNAPRTLQELRDVQDWIVRPQLRTVPGVVEVNSVGGAAKQITITPHLTALQAYGLSMAEIRDGIRKNSLNVGAGFIEQNGEQFLLRVPSQVQNLHELQQVVVGMHNSHPIYVRDVADVEIGSELRAGAATQNGREVVMGTVFMLLGENGRDVALRVRASLEQIQRSVPAGIRLNSVYDRSVLVNSTIDTVRTNLIEGALLVIVILFLALGNFRAACITACVIPLSMLITIFGMVQSKMSANLMSLGALDFGLIVDGAVILVENCIRRFGLAQKELGRELTEQERLSLVYEGAVEVRQATMFGELIIMVVYVPILALSGVEGKMFHPMAITVLLALGAAFVASLTFVPAAVAVFLRGRFKEEQVALTKCSDIYRQILQWALGAPKRVFGAVFVLLVASAVMAFSLGAEFIPHLDEGDIALHALRIPGTSLSQAVSMQDQLEKHIKSIPEVSHTFAKIGTAEIATDPMPPSVADGFVMLKPRSQWPDPKKPKAEVVAELERVVSGVPGNNYEFTQPIQMRFNELIAGVRSDLAVKIFGDDMQLLASLGAKVRGVLEGIPGASDVKVEVTSGLPVLSIVPDREALGRFGLTSADLQDIVRTAYAGEEIAKFYEGDRNYPIVVRLNESERHSIPTIETLPLRLPDGIVTAPDMFSGENMIADPSKGLGKYVTLGQVAKVALQEGPNQISRENGKRRVVVTVNVRGRDLGSFVEDARSKIQEQVAIPTGYWISWGGQFEHLISAKARFMIIAPLVILVVFALIYLTLRDFTAACLVFTGVPFALTGGVIALWLRDIPFSISAAVGFIALSGIAVLNGLVLVSFVGQRAQSLGDRRGIIIDSALSRLRPVIMTALVASLGFIPMAISQGTGSEVQRPLATVVIGGIVSSTVLTLCVLPVLLSVLGEKSRRVRASTE